LSFALRYIPRAKNADADGLTNEVVGRETGEMHERDEKSTSEEVKILLSYETLGT
jgi:hypothetical protein